MDLGVIHCIRPVYDWHFTQRMDFFCSEFRRFLGYLLYLVNRFLTAENPVDVGLIPWGILIGINLWKKIDQFLFLEAHFYVTPKVSSLVLVE